MKKFLDCEIFIYTNAKCSAAEQTRVCQLIVTDTRRFELYEDGCSEQLFNYCSTINFSDTLDNRDGTNFAVAVASNLSFIFLLQLILTSKK